MMLKYLAVAAALTMASSSIAETSALFQLRQFTGELESLTADFVQQVEDANGGLIETTEGSVYLQQPDYFRWDYRGEYPQQIIADGQRVWIYDEALEQVTVKPQSELAADSPLSILTHPNMVDEQFRVTELGEEDGIALMELAPLGEEPGEFQRITLGFQALELRLLVLEDAFGQRTRIEFAELKRNIGLEPTLFAFTPPEGVDVIGDDGDVPNNFSALQDDQFE